MEENLSNFSSQQPDPHDPWWMPSFTQTVELADGTTFNGSAMLNGDAGELWVWLKEGTDMGSAFAAFSDQEKTKKIVSHTSSIETYTWEGYTQLSLIKIDNQKVSIRMRKP